jgi:hypothetical protein
MFKNIFQRLRNLRDSFCEFLIVNGLAEKIIYNNYVGNRFAAENAAFAMEILKYVS